MLTLSIDRKHRVLRVGFSRLFTTEDLDAIDLALVRFLGVADDDDREIRALYDMTGVQALAVPQSRFAERAGKPAIGDLTRVVAAPRWAGEDFGQSYRQARGLWPHAQPTIAASLAEAYDLLGIVDPHFEPYFERLHKS